MNWTLETLGALVGRDGGLIQTGPFGAQLKRAEYTDDGIPVIMPTDIRDGKIETEEIARTSKAKATTLSRHKVKKNSIVFPRRGEITKRAFISDVEEGWLCGTGCLKIETENSSIDPKYLYYYMDLPSSVAWLRNNAVGSTMLNLSAKIMERFPVKYPEILAQKQIANTLSAYDNLIENNRRRIALLEESTRLLYREWFVHLRFPGHETTKIIDGVPEGWTFKTVKESVNRVPPGNLFSQKTVFQKGTVPVLDQGQKGVIGYHDEDASLNASKDDPIIIFANHTCKQKIIHFPFSAIQNVLPYVPSEHVPNEVYWLHHATLGLVRINGYKGHWPEFSAKELLVPTNILAKQFSKIASKVHLQIFNLEKQSEKLAEARDLMLPRLMDGRLEVAA